MKKFKTLNVVNDMKISFMKFFTDGCCEENSSKFLTSLLTVFGPSVWRTTK